MLLFPGFSRHFAYSGRKVILIVLLQEITKEISINLLPLDLCMKTHGYAILSQPEQYTTIAHSSLFCTRYFPSQFH